MNTSMQTKPSLVTAIGIMTLVNGIFNIIWGLGIIGTTGFLALICAAPIPLFPIILGGFEIAYALKLLSDPPQPVKPSQAIAWWEIAAILVLNVFSAVVGILVLVFYNDSIVKDYFARLNAPQTPPTPPAEPFDTTQDKLVPATSSPVESVPVDEVPAWLKSDAPAIEAPATEAPAQPVEPEAKPAKKKSPAKAKPVRKIAKK
jgi:hypothetical protein